jgi:hypothetical protein
MKTLIDKSVVLCHEIGKDNKIIYQESNYNFLNSLRGLKSFTHNICIQNIKVIDPSKGFTAPEIKRELKAIHMDFLTKEFKCSIDRMYYRDGLIDIVIMETINSVLNNYQQFLKKPEYRKLPGNRINIPKEKVFFKSEKLAEITFDGDEKNDDVYIKELGFFKFTEDIKFNVYRIHQIYLKYVDDTYELHVIEDQSIKKPITTKDKTDYELFDDYQQSQYDAYLNRTPPNPEEDEEVLAYQAEENALRNMWNRSNPPKNFK